MEMVRIGKNIELCQFDTQNGGKRKCGDRMQSVNNR